MSPYAYLPILHRSYTGGTIRESRWRRTSTSLRRFSVASTSSSFSSTAPTRSTTRSSPTTSRMSTAPHPILHSASTLSPNPSFERAFLWLGCPPPSPASLSSFARTASNSAALRAMSFAVHGCTSLSSHRPHLSSRLPPLPSPHLPLLHFVRIIHTINCWTPTSP